MQGFNRMAERAGFEPAEPFGSHALQACALGRTTQPLPVFLWRFSCKQCRALCPWSQASGRRTTHYDVELRLRRNLQ